MSGNRNKEEQRVYMREYYRRRRKQHGKSPITLLAEMQTRICQAWDEGIISEGFAMRLLGVDRVAARMVKEQVLSPESLKALALATPKK